jgi:hypothetical protein
MEAGSAGDTLMRISGSLESMRISALSADLDFSSGEDRSSNVRYR